MTELRALEVFSTVPPGCILQCIVNDDSDPHLRPGEFAVIDTSDREPQSGELFLIKWSSGRTAIVQVFAREHYHPEDGQVTGWWTRSLRRIDFDMAYAEAKRQTPRGHIVQIPRGSYVDGPRRKDGIMQALIGRVIGIYQAVDVFPSAVRQIGSNRQ